MHSNHKSITNYPICVSKHYRKKKQLTCSNIINLIQNRGLGTCISNTITENHFLGKSYSSNTEEAAIDALRKLKLRINKKVNISFPASAGHCRNVWED